MKPLGAITFLIVLIQLASCGNDVETASVSFHDKKDYDSLLNSRKNYLGNVLMKIQASLALSDTVSISDTFLIDDNILGFSPVMGTHSDSAEPYENFNSLMLAYYGSNDSLPPGMKEDWFISNVYRDLRSCASGGTVQSYSFNETDDRMWSTGYAFLEAMDSLRYIIVVKPISFSAGEMYATRDSYTPAEMEAVLMIYDLKEERICGAKKIKASGPESFTYQYKEASSNNGWKDNSEAAALSKFETSNKESVVRETYESLGPQFKIE